MNIRMWPDPQPEATNGIQAVVQAYHRYLPDHGITFVKDPNEAALFVGHAGTPPTAHVAMLHGLNWTGDLVLPQQAYAENAQIVKALRFARAVTVPSEWVAETLRREMHLVPWVVGHGIELGDWEPEPTDEAYVLWNKNRMDAVCDPAPVNALAQLAPGTQFVSTFGIATSNVKVIGLQAHAAMRALVRQAGLYLATTKETFGIGTLEALASGIPVLGYNWGGTAELVQHKLNGWLAEPGDVNGLLEGLSYCQQHRARLAEAAHCYAKPYSWERIAGEVASIWRCAATVEPPSCAIVIPCYNKAETVAAAMRSAVQQSFASEVIVVDDGSTDNSLAVIKTMQQTLDVTGRKVTVLPEHNGGVAHARNVGWQHADAKYICFLDADDLLAPSYIETCVKALELDPSLALAYTGLGFLLPDGSTRPSRWPPDCDYDQQLRRNNQVSTCCVMQRTVLERTGGYRSDYAPLGAGSEDAELWLRVGALGMRMRQVDPRPLFIYRPNGATKRSEYKEPDWTMAHPWCRDGLHPFASLATPRYLSHPVHAYDRPHISVILHGSISDSENWRALEAFTRTCDSLEAQTFRNWEVVHPHGFESHLPFVWPRNPRGKVLVHLRTGDWMHPTALAALASVPAGVYRYEGHHLWEESNAEG